MFRSPKLNLDSKKISLIEKLCDELKISEILLINNISASEQEYKFLIKQAVSDHLLTFKEISSFKKKLCAILDIKSDNIHVDAKDAVENAATEKYISLLNQKSLETKSAVKKDDSKKKSL